MRGKVASILQELLSSGPEWNGRILYGQKLRIMGDLLQLAIGARLLTYRLEDVVLGLLGATAPPSGREFPFRPLGSPPNVLHVETVEKAEVLVCYWPESVRTVIAENRPFPGRNRWNRQEATYESFTLRFHPVVSLSLLVEGSATSHRGLFAVKESPPTLSSSLFVPALMNVSIGAYGFEAREQKSWACFSDLYPTGTPMSLAQHAQHLERETWFSQGNYSSDAHEGLSGFRLIADLWPATRPELKSHAVWETATLQGQDLWTKQELPPLDLTLGQEIENLFRLANVGAAALDQRVRAALPTVLAGLAPLDEKEGP